MSGCDIHLSPRNNLRLVVVTCLITIKLKYNLRLLMYDQTKREGDELEVKGLFLIGNYAPPNDHDFRTVLPSV